MRGKKMRLIDADKLMESLKTKESVWVGLVLSELIANAPTAEAIPVEWLKRWFETQVWRGSSPTDRIHCKASDIIEDWEKENE